MQGAAWYLVYTKAQREHIAFEQLERQHYHCYLPMHRVNKRIRGNHRLIEVPLFARYLFVRLDLSKDNSAPIRSTIGVSHLVRFGTQLASVPTEFISYCQQRWQQPNVAPTAALFEPGDPVQIMAGPFAGYDAVFRQAQGSERALVMLNIAQSFTQLSVEQACLDKVA